MVLFDFIPESSEYKTASESTDPLDKKCYRSIDEISAEYIGKCRSDCCGSSAVKGAQNHSGQNYEGISGMDVSACSRCRDLNYKSGNENKCRKHCRSDYM